MPNDNYYIPGVPQNLQGILYTPRFNASEVKRLREKFAGDAAAQSSLMVDDRYHQGKGMMEASPLAALATFGGSVPYDAAKVAYFNSPRPVQKLIERGTEALFPGEGFNLQTTARPSRAGSAAYLHGMAEGAYGSLRQKLVDLNNQVFPDGVIDRVRDFTREQNEKPHLSTALMPNQDEIVNAKTPAEARKALRNFTLQAAAAHAVDGMGTGKKVLSTVLQTINPDFDTRQQFDAWAEDRGIQAVAPGLKPLKPMTAEQKKAQNAELSRIMSTWGKPQPTQFPINMMVEVPK